MGISSGPSTKWLFAYCIQVELEFGNGNGKTGVPGEKSL